MKKRIFSAIIALIMVVSSFAPVSSFASIGDDFPYVPYLNEDNYYYRIYDGRLKSFNTDWNSMVDYFATEISACKTSVTFEFATPDYPYTYNTTRNTVPAISEYLYEDLMTSIAEEIGDDFYTVGHHNIVGYLNNGDNPHEDNPNKERYYPFTITLSAIEYTNNDFPSYPTLSEGKYYRISNNSPVAFNTDWDEMIEYIQSKLMGRANSVTYYFATTDEKYAYTKNSTDDNSDEVCDAFVRDVLTAVYKKDSALPSNAAGGDYLFKSIKNIGTHGYTGYLSDGDNPLNEEDDRYYTFSISFNNISYFTTLEQEEIIRVYCQDFSERFIADGATDYEKVKTIFDFVVRNTKYDYDVFRNRDLYPVSSERYTIAHSAYGALRGNLGENDNYNWSRKRSVTGMTVISTADQGMAVCEGYSKLFYYLCVMNGIPCRIVDGAYVKESGKEKDPHEWNYVWLDDGSEDAPKWFEVDTTFAAQKSFKDADLNDYDYFLCGRENINFGWMNHQQPFHMKDDHEEGEEYNILTANVIYDYWGDNGDSTYISSLKDYQFRKLNLAEVDPLESGYVVRRSTDYAGEDDTKVALIHSTKDGQYIINIDDDGTWLPTDKHGFIYNGQSQSIYEVIIPYLDKREYDVETKTNIVDVGEYTLTITGANGTHKDITFSIIPMDLDNSHEGNYDLEKVNIQDSAVFTGHSITPEAYIVDGYKNVLTEGKDYAIYAYKDAQHTQLTEIKEIGTYYIDVNYEVGKNYSGHYYLTFTVTKIGIDQIGNINDIEFDYLPESLRNQNQINTPADYFKAGASSLTMNGYPIVIDKDISVTSIGGLSGGESGRIIFTGLASSDYIAEGSVKNIKYTVSGKYDISYLDDQYADSGKTNVYFYTGKAIKPVRFDHLDGFLDQGVDYVIDSYENNTDAGQATVVIKGINGCKGTARMHFYINKASITNAVLSTSTSTGTVTYTLTFNGKDLVKNTDYTETITQTATGYTITLTGINNFNGSTSINVTENRVKPTSTGNYITLSKSTYVYSGSANKPTVAVYNKSKKAISTYYYTVSYSANTNPGTAKVTVKFRNGYSGTITKTFTINPKATTLSSLTPASKAITVKWKKYATQTTGYEIQYATDSKFTKNKKTVAITKNSTTSKKLTKLTGKKKYYVRIRTYKTVSGKKYYSSWSASKNTTTKK